MGCSCSEALTRIIVFVANFLFLLVGGALLTIGILYAINFNKYTDAIPSDYGVLEYVPILSIVVGSVIFLIAFLGCCGTLRSSTCMLNSYAIILLVIFFAQVALGVFALLQIKNTDDLKAQLDKELPGLFGRYIYQNETEVVDLIQSQFKCCGVTGPMWWITNFAPTPKSCFSNESPLVPYQQGCSEALCDYLFSSLRLIGIVALAISVTEILSAVLAFGLSNCIKANERRAGYSY